jgi:hypothetical protein
MQARFYSPVLKRFLSEDPAGFSGGINLYAFAGGNPVDFMDPFGLGPVTSGGKQWYDYIAVTGISLVGALTSSSANGSRQGVSVLVDNYLDWRGLSGDAALNATSNISMAAGDLGQAVGVARAGLNYRPNELANVNSVAKPLYLDAGRYPISASNLELSGATGVPLTVNRAGAAANRASALKGIQKVSGSDLDEAPPAVFRLPQTPVIVISTPPSDNRGAGASLGNQARTVPDGGHVIIFIEGAAP